MTENPCPLLGDLDDLPRDEVKNLQLISNSHAALNLSLLGGALTLGAALSVSAGWAQVLAWLAFLLAFLVGSVALILLALEVFGRATGTLLAILAFVPLVGLLALLFIERRALEILGQDRAPGERTLTRSPEDLRRIGCVREG